MLTALKLVFEEGQGRLNIMCPLSPDRDSLWPVNVVAVIKLNQGGPSTGQTTQIQHTVHPVYSTLVCYGLVGW